MQVRKAVFSGSWYPSSASACKNEIDQFLAEIDTTSLPAKTLMGGIVPHAGWYFSGSIACNVIHALSKGEAPDVIVIFGMHLSPMSPNYMMAEGAWETPFGELPISEELAEELAEKFDFKIESGSYTQDNTIELQLPFIKHFFQDVKILPIGVPPVKKSLEIGNGVVEFATKLDLKIKVIGSTDLTHYGANYGFSPKGTGPAAVDWVREENDRRVIDAMLAMDPESVIGEAASSHNACCSGAAATAISAVKRLGADSSALVSYSTSYDKSPGDSLVGYAGIVFKI